MKGQGFLSLASAARPQLDIEEIVPLNLQDMKETKG